MHFVTLLTEIHSVSRPEIKPQLRESFAYGRNISKVSIFDTIDPSPHSTAGRRIQFIVKPFSERLAAVIGLADQNVARSSVQVKSGLFRAL
jgi:hypothetical protein